MSSAAYDLATAIECDIRLPLAREKSAVVSNNLKTACLLRSALGDLGGPPLGSVRSLGIDFWSSAPVKHRMKVRSKRKKDLAKRTPRLLALRSVSPNVSGKVFVCGVLPSILFDAPVYGLFGESLKEVRRTTAKMLGIAGKKPSLDLCFSFVPEKDPEIMTASRLVHQYTKEVWNASQPLALRDQAGIPLGILASGASAFLKNNPNGPNKVDGPISALDLALRNCGWAFKSPFVWLNRAKAEVHLPTFCPTRIVKMHTDDYAQAIKARAVLSLASDDNAVEFGKLCDRGLFLEPIISLYNRLDRARAETLMAITTNGIFTNTDLHNKGYDVNFTCSNCHQARDTIFHRCFSCPFVEHKARLALGDSLFNVILEEGDASIKGKRCLFPMSVRNIAASAQTVFSCFGMDIDEMLLPENGKIYGDGSCLNPSIKGLARAGWAIVQVNEDGDVIKSIHGCVPAMYAQTSLAAEHMAFWVAFENSARGIYAGDCADVLGWYHKGWKELQVGRSPHADLCRSVLGRAGDCLDGIVDVAKVKAHRTLRETLDLNESVVDFHGNQQADLLAKKGAELHPPNSPDVNRYKARKKEVTHLALHMIDCLMGLRSERNASYENLQRLPANVKLNLASDSIVDAHRFTWNGTCWICLQCCFRSADPSRLDAKRARCKGTFPLFKELYCDPKGHDLFISEFGEQEALIHCTKCWGYASAVTRKLNSVCSGVAGKAYPCARSFLLRSMHPISRLRLCKPARMHGQPFLGSSRGTAGSDKKWSVETRVSTPHFFR